MISSRCIPRIRAHYSLTSLLNVRGRRYDEEPVIQTYGPKIPTTPSVLTPTGTQLRTVSTSYALQTRIKAMSGEGDHESLNLNYEDLLRAQKESDTLIVDVREDNEIVETGKLPGSIHIPMGEVASVFSTYSDQAFLEKYQKPKPAKDTKIVFSCRSGKRSATVQDAIQKLGYEKCYNYTGGWLEWESRQAA